MDEIDALLANFWHPKNRGELDGFQVIRRTGTGKKRREVSVDDLPALEREARRALRRYIAESDEKRASSAHPGRAIAYVGCAFPCCKKPHRRGGYCDSHSAQLRRNRKLAPLRGRAPNGRPAWIAKDYYRLRLAREGRVTKNNLSKTHCPTGHPYAGGNLYVSPSGARQCRQCQRNRDTKRKPPRRAGRKGPRGASR